MVVITGKNSKSIFVNENEFINGDIRFSKELSDKPDNHNKHSGKLLSYSKSGIMANPHHRKKHKEHLRQFQNRVAGSTGESKAKAKASSVFAVGGAVVGMAIFYFATQGDFIWALGGGVLGAGIGFLIGKNIDRAAKK